MLNWMIKNGRLSQNPLMPVQKLAFVPAWTRRAFRDDELRRLLEVASESRLGYLLAVYTGLRRSELKALCWENVDLDGEVPTVSLSGRFTKNKQNACIPLHPQVLEELGASKPADAKPSDAVLMGKMLPSMWKMKKDLRRAYPMKKMAVVPTFTRSGTRSQQILPVKMLLRALPCNYSAIVIFV